MRSRLFVAGVLVAGTLVACGGGESVDQVEEEVGDELKAQLARQNERTDLEEPPESATVDRIDCPDDADTSEGAAFRCRALNADDRVVGTVTVQMRSDTDAQWQFVAAAPS